MKNRLFNILLLVVVTILVFYFTLSSDFEGIIKQVFSLNVTFVFLAFMFMVLYWFFRSIILHKLILKFKPEHKFKKTFRLKLATQFFNAITPFASGGQPFQVYMLTKDNIGLGNSTCIIIQNFIIYQIALIFMGIAAIISNYVFHIFPSVKILKELVLLGFVVNSLVTLVLFLITFNKKINNFIVDKGIKILGKLGIIKDKEKKLIEWKEYLNNFDIGARELLKNKTQFVLFVFLDIIALSFLYLVPLMVLYGTGDFTSFNAFESIVGTSYVMLIGSFVPIPGGTGGLEYGFTQFFGVFITGSGLMAIMLVWRFVTYYLGLFIGAIAINLKTKE